MSERKLFVFGIGYTATRTAIAFKKNGYKVAGTVRSTESASALTKEFPDIFHYESLTAQQNLFLFDAFEWNSNNSISVSDALKGTTHLLISVPPTICGRGDPILFALRDKVIEAVKDTIQWTGYLSTIGVYGETNGVAVDESAPVQSAIPRCQARISAEVMWLATGLSVHIFRIAGIYGPGRGPLQRIRMGHATRIHIPGKLFHRIHVDDIVQVLQASADSPNAGSIYNVSDNEAAAGDVVIAYGCELRDKPVPPSQSYSETEKTMSEMAKSFYAESKIIKNEKIRNELGVRLRYPTFREGFLAQILEESRMANGISNERWIGKSECMELVFAITDETCDTKSFLSFRRICFRLSKILQTLVEPCTLQEPMDLNETELYRIPAKSFQCTLRDVILSRKIGDATNNPLRILIIPFSIEPTSQFIKRIQTEAKISFQNPKLSVDIRIPSQSIQRSDINCEETLRSLLFPSQT